MGTRAPVTLVWLEGADPASAAGVHLAGTLERMTACGIVPARVVAARSGTRSRTARLVGLLARSIRQPRRGVLVARWHPLLLPAVVVNRLRGGRCVLLVQGVLAEVEAVHPWVGRSRVLRWCALRPLQVADALVAPSDGIARWLHRETGRSMEDITRLANGADLELFRSARRAPEVPPYAVFVGNLAAWQGVVDLLDAARDPAWPGALRLEIVGDGTEGALVAARCDERVVWHGRLGRDAMAHVLGGALVAFAVRADVGASAAGTAPFKVIEAASAAVPVVATNVPGQAELVADLGHGVLVEPGDPHAIAAAVRAIVDDPKRRARLSDAGAVAAERYTWRAGAAALAEALRRAQALPRTAEVAR